MKFLQVGELAPTSRNLKPCTFHLVQDREVLQTLSKAKKAEIILRGRICGVGNCEAAAEQIMRIFNENNNPDFSKRVGVTAILHLLIL